MTSSSCPKWSPLDFCIGYPAIGYNPALEEYKHMLHLVAYDIRDSKRLSKVARICKDYGFRVEYSVFECDLSNEIFHEFWTKLNEVIDDEEDCLLAYQICGRCVKEIRSSGVITRPERPLAYIF